VRQLIFEQRIWGFAHDELAMQRLRFLHVACFAYTAEAQASK